MIWAFLGDLHRAEQVPLPRVTPYGDSGSVGLVVATKVEAHWSFLLDNGIDLFHGHLHREVPYFFSIQAIEDFGSDGDEFVVRYRATIGGPFRTRRRGIITIRTEGTGMMLDLDGYPIVHGLVTPHTADGRRFTTWYMVAFALPPVHRLVVRILMPALRRCLRRGFCEDSAVLASEQAAFDTGCRTQWEVNPVVPAVHRHVADLIVRRAWRLRSEGAQPVRIARATLLQCAGRGEIAVFGRRAGQPSLIAPSELDGCLPDRPLVEVMQYRNCYFLNAS